MPWPGITVGRLVVVLAALFVFVALPGPIEARQTPAQSYERIADNLNLQSEPEILAADDDWRARVGAEDTSSRDMDWLREIPWGLVLRVVIWGLAAALLATIVYLVWRYGAAIQVGLSDNSDEGRVEDRGGASQGVLLAESKAKSLDDILAMDDTSRALGALQRLVLEAALAAMNATLRKSDTARAVLRRLPREWKHFSPVAAMVRQAERVRFAGDAFDRAGLEAIVESVRPVLRQAGPVR